MYLDYCYVYRVQFKVFNWLPGLLLCVPGSIQGILLCTWIVDAILHDACGHDLFRAVAVSVRS